MHHHRIIMEKIFSQNIVQELETKYMFRMKKKKKKKALGITQLLVTRGSDTNCLGKGTTYPLHQDEFAQGVVECPVTGTRRPIPLIHPYLSALMTNCDFQTIKRT